MRWTLLIIPLAIAACNGPESRPRYREALVTDTLVRVDSAAAYAPAPDSAATTVVMRDVDTRDVRPDAVVDYARTLVGSPYKYGGTDPATGVDCSGFITAVFSHFDIEVPRSSIDFADVGRTVPVAEARPGDLILFTGTIPGEEHIGHMGLVASNGTDSLHFLHATSGKAMSVVLTPFNAYYQTRFVRIARIFPF